MDQYDDDVYQFQFFGFTADELDAGFKANVEFIAREHFQKTITDINVNGSEEDVTKLTTLSDKIISGFLEDVKENVNLCSENIRETLKIPNNILHPNDEENVSDFSEEYKQNILADIEKLEQRAKQAEYLSKAMEKELEENKLLISGLENKLKSSEEFIEEFESEVNSVIEINALAASLREKANVLDDAVTKIKY